MSHQRTIASPSRGAYRPVRNFGLAFAAFAVTALALPAAPVAAAEVTWTFAHTTPVRGSTFDRYATTVLPERLKKATNGRLQIDVVQGIIAPQDLLKSVRGGRVQGGSLIIAYAAASYPRWVPLGLPGLLKKEADYIPAVEKVVLPVMQKEAAESWGAKPIVIGAFAGVGVFSKSPLDSVEKFSGLKFRTASPEQAQLMKAAGGAAVSMPFGELYTSMQRGLVDAFTSSANSIVDSKMHEIVGHASRWPIGLNIWSFFFSEEAIAKLPDDLRKLVLAELEVLHQEALREGVRDAESGWKRVGEAGLKILDPSAPEMAKMVGLAEKNVWPNWIERAGAGSEKMIKDIQALGTSN